MMSKAGYLLAWSIFVLGPSSGNSARKNANNTQTTPGTLLCVPVSGSHALVCSRKRPPTAHRSNVKQRTRPSGVNLNPWRPILTDRLWHAWSMARVSKQDLKMENDPYEGVVTWRSALRCPALWGTREYL